MLYVQHMEHVAISQSRDFTSVYGHRHLIRPKPDARKGVSYGCK